MDSVARRLPNPRRPIGSVGWLAAPSTRLVLTSATLLFVELLLIRWIPAYVRYVGFFTNFLLTASFLGIGIGILLGRRGHHLPLSPFAPLLLATVALVYGAQLNIQARDPNEINFGLDASTSADVNFLVMPLVVVLVTALMASLALPLGPLLRSGPPLRCYALDIVGSLLGIAGFTLLAFLGTGPLAWFSVVAVLLVLLALGAGPTPWSMLSGVSMALALWIVAVPGATSDVWSPYYRISMIGADLAPASADLRAGRPPKYISVDGIPHQSMLAAEEAARQELHRQVFAWFPDRTFERVLIIGSGTGTDTALVLARGATHVDAVEIDPRLARIGRDFHPEQVYTDPRVTVHVNDGRAFLRSSSERYDLVIYALTDSLTLVSSAAGVRLESFLFTAESIDAAREHLGPDGIFLMYNHYREPWLVAKLVKMAESSFGHQPLLRLVGRSSAIIAAGPAVAALNGRAPPGDRVDQLPPIGEPTPQPATDDWPFLYLRVPGVAAYYLAALAFVLLLAILGVVGAARATATPLRRFSPHFFVLGVAFLLLETRSLVTFSLLFGTTWVVNALTFFAILASVLLAILINARLRIRRTSVLYLALFASLAVAYVAPADALLAVGPELRYVVAAAIAFAPVFIANLVFTHSFGDTRSADMAFASNLLGAMVGGALEYVSLVTGFGTLLFIVAALYAAAYLLAGRFRILADVDLRSERSPLRP